MSNFFQVKDILIKFMGRVIKDCHAEDPNEVSPDIIDGYVLQIQDVFRNNPQMQGISNDDLINEIDRRIRS